MKKRLIALAIILVSVFGISTVAYAGPTGGCPPPIYTSLPICPIPIEADYTPVDKQP